MSRYQVELLQPVVSVTLEAASDEEAHWLAVETFADDIRKAPMRITELNEEKGE